MTGSRRAPAVVAALALLPPGRAAAQAVPAAEIFQTHCAACHTIGGGRLVGPDLQGLRDRRSEQWIIAFIQHPQQMIAADSTARRLFQEYQEIPMPDQALSAAEIRGLIAYFSGAAAPAAPPAQAAGAAATPEQILRGRGLFRGTARLANGGPTCTSCHNVAQPGILGGTLARDLTAAHERLGSAGIEGILGAPPFPMMQRAYASRPLTEDERQALAAFLGSVDAAQPPRAGAARLLAAGAAGMALLLGLYGLLWARRRRGSVHQRIFDRQITST
jgi:mono/diheme cytochrome c family protein